MALDTPLLSAIGWKKCRPAVSDNTEENLSKKSREKSLNCNGPVTTPGQSVAEGRHWTPGLCASVPPAGLVI